MSLDHKSIMSKLPAKRDYELEGTNVEHASSSKRQQSSASTAYKHGPVPILEASKIVPKKSKSTKSSKNLSKTESDCTSDTKRSVSQWLESVSPVDSSSKLAAQLNSQTTNADSPSQGVRRLLQSSKPHEESPSVGQPSVESDQDSRPSTFHPMYRSTIYNNGVYIDETGDMIPKALKDFLKTKILKERKSKLSPTDVDTTKNTAISIRDTSEQDVYNLLNTAMFPINRSDMRKGGQTLWSTEPVPRNVMCPNSMSVPKPDVHIGYCIDMESSWTVQERFIISHAAVMPYARPGKGNCFPFLMLELKCEATGGTIWQAQNQLAGCGPHSVNSIRWLLQEAYPSKHISMLDTISFTVALTHREAVFHITFYSEKDETYYMSTIQNCSTFTQVGIQKSNHIIQNILDYALGPRQKKIRSALRNMDHFLAG